MAQWCSVRVPRVATRGASCQNRPTPHVLEYRFSSAASCESFHLNDILVSCCVLPAFLSFISSAWHCHLFSLYLFPQNVFGFCIFFVGQPSVAWNTFSVPIIFGSSDRTCLLWNVFFFILSNCGQATWFFKSSPFHY
uniref:Uncharacterized protein n=1 Tax=Ixodes ricinus TaxID=34613 RepID=A0A6B0USL9_IXORI